MTKIEKIEQSITALSNDEFWQFAERFAELQQARWDRQIELDSESGKLDDVIAKARSEIARGKVTPL